MKTDPEQRERVRRRNAAYAAAVKRLIALHPVEWDCIYREEAARQGVNPRGARS